MHQRGPGPSDAIYGARLQCGANWDEIWRRNTAYPSGTKGMSKKNQGKEKGATGNAHKNKTNQQTVCPAVIGKKPAAEGGKKRREKNIKSDRTKRSCNAQGEKGGTGRGNSGNRKKKKRKKNAESSKVCGAPRPAALRTAASREKEKIKEKRCSQKRTAGLKKKPSI